MSAAEKALAPGVAKVRHANRPHLTVCRDERHDGDPSGVGWVNDEGICAKCLAREPRCACPEHRGRWKVGAVLVSADLNAEGYCTACARAMPEIRRNGARQDNRHGVELGGFPRKEITIGFGTSRDYLAAFAVAPLAQTMRRVLIFALENTDGPTWVCYRHRGYFLKHLGTGKAATRTILQDLELEGVVLRHHIPKGDGRLVSGSTEADEGCSVLEWALLPGPELDAALGRAAARNRAREKRGKTRGKVTLLNAREEIGIDLLNAREEIGIDLVDRDRASRSGSISTSICDLRDQDPLLSLRPTTDPPTSALSPFQGDRQDDSRALDGALDEGDLAGSAGTETERTEEPPAPRLSSLSETASPESESTEGEDPDETEMRTARGPEAPPPATTEPQAPAPNVDSEPTSAKDGAFARTTAPSTPVRFLPETSRAISRLVGRCKRASEAANLVPLDMVKLFGWCVDRVRAGAALEWLEAWAVGVARGQGEAKDGRAAAKEAVAEDGSIGVNAFVYATGNPELYVHEGRKLREAEGAAEASKRHAEALPDRLPAPPDETRIRIALFQHTGEPRWLDNSTPLPRNEREEP